MIKIRLENKKEVESALKDLLKKQPMRFSHIDFNSVPEAGGVYLITKINGRNETPYYVGRSKNMQDRLKEHVNRTGFKRYLVDQNKCSSLKEAKNYALKHCAVRWLREDNYKARARMEGYFTALLFPKCGIYKEH